MSKLKIKGNASGTGTVTVEAPNTNTDRTITLPDSAGELINIAPSTSGNVLTSDGTDWTSAAAAAGGKVLQVVSNVDTSPSTTSTTSTSYVTTGYSVTITPSATTSKIFLTWNSSFFCSSANNDEVWVAIFRDSTTTAEIISQVGGWLPSPISYLDSPASTSTITYTVKFRSNQNNTIYSVHSGVPVSLVAMEIGA